MEKDCTRGVAVKVCWAKSSPPVSNRSRNSNGIEVRGDKWLLGFDMGKIRSVVLEPLEVYQGNRISMSWWLRQAQPPVQMVTGVRYGLVSKNQ